MTSDIKFAPTAKETSFSESWNTTLNYANLPIPWANPQSAKIKTHFWSPILEKHQLSSNKKTHLPLVLFYHLKKNTRNANIVEQHFPYRSYRDTLRNAIWKQKNKKIMNWPQNKSQKRISIFRSRNKTRKLFQPYPESGTQLNNIKKLQGNSYLKTSKKPKLHTVCE